MSCLKAGGRNVHEEKMTRCAPVPGAVWAYYTDKRWSVSSKKSLKNNF